MGTLYVLSGAGDTRLNWPHGQVSGDPEAQAAIAEAEALFATELRRGSTAFRLGKDRTAERIDAFDPLAEEIIILPRMAGG